MTHQRPPADTTSPTCKCGHGANSHEGIASCNAHHANWLRDACGCPQYRPAAVYQVTKIRPLTVAQMIGRPLFDITEWIGGPRWMVTDPDGREVARCDTQTGAYAIARAVADVAAMRDRMTRLEQRLYGRHPARSGWKAAHAEMNVDDIAQRAAGAPGDPLLVVTGWTHAQYAEAIAKALRRRYLGAAPRKPRPRPPLQVVKPPPPPPPVTTVRDGVTTVCRKCWTVHTGGCPQ